MDHVGYELVVVLRYIAFVGSQCPSKGMLPMSPTLSPNLVLQVKLKVTSVFFSTLKIEERP